MLLLLSWLVLLVLLGLLLGLVLGLLLGLLLCLLLTCNLLLSLSKQCRQSGTSAKGIQPRVHVDGGACVVLLLRLLGLRGCLCPCGSRQQTSQIRVNLGCLLLVLSLVAWLLGLLLLLQSRDQSLEACGVQGSQDIGEPWDAGLQCTQLLIRLLDLSVARILGDWRGLDSLLLVLLVRLFRPEHQLCRDGWVEIVVF